MGNPHNHFSEVTTLQILTQRPRAVMWRCKCIKYLPFRWLLCQRWGLLRGQSLEKKTPCYVLRSRLKLKLLMMDVLLIGLERLFPLMSRARTEPATDLMVWSYFELIEAYPMTALPAGLPPLDWYGFPGSFYEPGKSAHASGAGEDNCNLSQLLGGI